MKVKIEWDGRPGTVEPYLEAGVWRAALMGHFRDSASIWDLGVKDTDAMAEAIRLAVQNRCDLDWEIPYAEF